MESFKIIHINPWQKDKCLNWFKLKAFADNKLNLAEQLKFVLGRVENIVEKGENADDQHFLLFPQCFQKFLSKGRWKSGLCCKEFDN